MKVQTICKKGIAITGAIPILLSSLFVGSLPLPAQAQVSVSVSDFESTSNQNNLISDANFIDYDSMTTSSIQAFLAGKGAYIANYSEGGRSAAQIIYDAAHGHGDASGSINSININSGTGTVSPKVLLVMLHKEQSLVGNNTDNIGTRLTKAMGYACPDNGSSNDTNNNGCNDAYEGFTKQVENAAWQLRYNYEAAKLGADWWNQNYAGQEQYYVGITKTFIDLSSQQHNTATIGNAATASLYRYTPHVYNGNYNFWKYFNSWFEYSHSYVGQNDHPVLFRGEAARLELTVRNTGKVIWDQNTVHLATDRSKDRVSPFIRESADGSPSGWLEVNRIKMQQTSVAPDENATFVFYLKATSDMPYGNYREYYRLVADGLGWLEDYGIYWDVSVVDPANAYAHRVINQSNYPTVAPGQAARFDLTVKNTSRTTWTKDTVHLGTDRNLDRVSPFIRESGDTDPNPSGWSAVNRIVMNENSVEYGQNATFTFYMQAPHNMRPGSYREYFRVVADGIKWMEDYGIYWDVTVIPTANAYSYSYISQSNYPTIARGQSNQYVLTIKNTGANTWTNDVVRLGLDHPQDRDTAFTHGTGWISTNRIGMDQASVAPGENATFTFSMQSPDSLTPGSYREYFRPVADGIKWMDDYGIYWDVVVN